MDHRLKKQIEFILEIDKEFNVSSWEILTFMYVMV